MSKASILKEAEKSLSIRIKRIYTVTPKGGPTGTSVELDGAAKDVARAQARQERAQAAHRAAMAEAVEFAEIITAMGGQVDFDALLADAPKVAVPTSETTADVDQVDDGGNPTDPEREPEPNDDNDDDPMPLPGENTDGPINEASTGPVRIGGRFAKRGAQVG